MFEYILSFGTVRCVSSKCIIELIFKLILDKFSSLFKSLFLSVLHRWAISLSWEVIFLLFCGRYRYKFIVDGAWHTDPTALTEQDEMGFENNILVVDSTGVG